MDKFGASALALDEAGLGGEKTKKLRNSLDIANFLMMSMLPLSSGLLVTAAGSGSDSRSKPRFHDFAKRSSLHFKTSSSFPLPIVRFSTLLLPRHNTPSPDQIIRVPRKQRLPVRAPRQTHTLGLPALLAHGRVLGLELVDLALLLEIEDDDGARRGGAEPVPVGGEDERVDLVAGGQGVEVLGLVEVPEHGGAVLAARGAEGAVGGDGHRVDVAGVADVVGLDAARGQFPDLWYRT